LQQVLHLFVFFCIYGVVQFLKEKVVVLLLGLLFLFLFKDLKVFLAFFDVGGLAHEVEGRRHLL